MTDTQVITIATQAMYLTVKLAAPILLVALVVGLTISLFQSVTQIQEMTLTFVPKLAAIALVILFAGHWMLAQVIAYTDSLYAMVPRLLGG